MIADVMNAWMSGGRNLRTEGKQRRIRRQQTATGSQSERATPESSPNPRSACCLFGFHEFTYTVIRHLRVVKIPKIKSKYFFCN